MKNRTLIFKVSTKTVTNDYKVELPTPRQFIQIEGEKTALTAGLYSDMMSASTESASYALDIVDMHAYFSVLIPNLISDLKVDGAMVDMDIMDFKVLKAQYHKQFVPWVNGWMKVLNAPVEELPKITDHKGDVSSNDEEPIIDLGS